MGDPLARLFALRPLPWLGRNLSYGVYILQLATFDFLTTYVLPTTPGSPCYGAASMLALLAVLGFVAAAVQFAVQKPIQVSTRHCSHAAHAHATRESALRLCTARPNAWSSHAPRSWLMPHPLGSQMRRRPWRKL